MLEQFDWRKATPEQAAQIGEWNHRRIELGKTIEEFVQRYGEVEVLDCCLGAMAGEATQRGTIIVLARATAAALHACEDIDFRDPEDD